MAQTAREQNYALAAQIARRLGKQLDMDVVNTLRRASLTLHRWAELECGDGNNYASWAIERDETTGKPYMCRYPYDGKMSRYVVADRERGALKRVEKLCAAHGLHYFHQTDPRGCSLYVAAEALTDSNYNNGIAV